ncbi:transcriptional adapter 2-alpha [Cephus cinctus]|uniref:Transcriptional adapter n=1 Tax=Cephus cinctus TaxID=211228 RepID=A0AAJ7RLS7_CEPCN|nr:transcriptional adapter 2-alpha [Cephus cinctus]XP_024943269.1 transcriptional adapter 2-alpha [Cephus cinctus]XP_024943270.1 transcriptional adapter 2-alpha [Cephus cinctus]XP_024943271.1 transcriptional adapter 2-alpha [Cephus cinctus]XP_024943272.1 transcriptional adapter 2-alpha [Cephus cinctus]
MANPSLLDMTEEDAADLQFPKDCPSSRAVETENDIELEVSVLKEEILTSDPTCRICKTILSEPYIRCAECSNVEICPPCFSSGSEVDEHRNNHNYIIIKNEFPLIENSGWTARQELELLDVLQECGFGNWVDISRRIQGKSPEECKLHYLQHYIDNQTLPGLPNIKETEASLFSSEPIPYLYKLHDLEEPPRFATNTVNCRLLAGYNAARSDFEVNFDNHAESLISDLRFDEFSGDDSDNYLGKSLQVAIVEAYNHRLRERKRRQQVIRDHGLIAFRRTMSWLHRYDSTITRPTAERLLIFMQLVKGMEFDYIMEGLHHAGELKNYIHRLLEFRKNGLKYFHSVPTFQKLTKLRQENEKDRRQYLTNAEYNWKSILPGCISKTNAPLTSTASQRKAPPPLVIKGLPGYEKLTAAEKELCSTARVVPTSYSDFKHLLITENKKCGSLRLAQARVLLKIDVNKTRKIYDFLAEQGYINKPVQ